MSTLHYSLGNNNNNKKSITQKTPLILNANKPFFFAKGYDTAKYLILISKIIKSHFNSRASIIEQSKSLQILLTYLF